jgi:antitoxin ParD1/3/4
MIPQQALEVMKVIDLAAELRLVPQGSRRLALRIVNNSLCYFLTSPLAPTILSRGDPMNISLTPELERMVDDKVKTGRYASASEVIREGLRLLEEQEQLKLQRLTAVRQKIDRGLEQLDKGQGIPGSDARARLRKSK